MNDFDYLIIIQRQILEIADAETVGGGVLKISQRKVYTSP